MRRALRYNNISTSSSRRTASKRLLIRIIKLEIKRIIDRSSAFFYSDVLRAPNVVTLDGRFPHKQRGGLYTDKVYNFIIVGVTACFRGAGGREIG